MDDASDEQGGDSLFRAGHMVMPTGVPVGLDEAAAHLAAKTDELAARRRTLAARSDEGAREVKDLHHAIALGAVLVRRGARAADSWRFDGLLSGTVEEFVARVTRAAQRLPGKAAGIALVGALDDDAAVLDAKGRFAAWRRKYRAYQERYASWRAAEPGLHDKGKWRSKPMSADQAELVRLTAALLEIDLPGELDRGGTHDWLEANGAPLRYRRVPT